MKNKEQKYNFEVYENQETLIDMIKIFRGGKLQYEGIWSAFEMWFRDTYPKEFHAYCQLDYDDEYDNSFLIPEQLQNENIDHILQNYITEFKDEKEYSK